MSFRPVWCTYQLPGQVESHSEVVSESKTNQGAEETAQQLKTLAVLAKDSGLVPNTHMVAHNPLELQL